MASRSPSSTADGGLSRVTDAAGFGTRVARVLAGGPPEAIVAAGAIGSWLSLVRAWNARIDLTAARSDDELVDLMVADAAELASRLPAGARVVDVGSGAGAPGVALAVLRPDLRVTLVEPLQKRVAFLRTVVGSVFGAPGRPEVVRARGEDLAGAKAFDVAVSRATLTPPAWLALGHALAPGGDVWVLLARDDPPALDGREVADDLRYAWPLTGAERRAVRYAPRSA
jgi:16S rRNA (guanine527-N7)-methyltransferase